MPRRTEHGSPDGFFRTDNRVPQSYIIQVIELGDSAVVRQMTLDSDGSGSLTLQRIRSGTGESGGDRSANGPQDHPARDLRANGGAGDGIG